MTSEEKMFEEFEASLRELDRQEEVKRRYIQHVREKRARMSEELEGAGYVYGYWSGEAGAWLSPHTGKLLGWEDARDEMLQYRKHGAGAA